MFDVRLKRAKTLVALGRRAATQPNYSSESPSPSSDSVFSSPTLTCSPASPWWNEVFEAADIQFKSSSKSSTTQAKRKLLFSPVKGSTAKPYPDEPYGCVLNCQVLDSSDRDIATDKPTKGLPVGGPASTATGETASQQPVMQIGDNAINHDASDASFSSEFFKAPQDGVASVLPPQEIYSKGRSRESHVDSLQDKSSCPEDATSKDTITINLEIPNTSAPSEGKHQVFIIVSGHIPTLKFFESLKASNSQKDVSADHCFKVNHASLSMSKCAKKRKIYPSQLRIRAAQEALNSGKEHTTVRGKVKPARYLKPSCNENCVRCEKPHLTESERLVIFNTFWELKNHVRQWEFISNSVTISPPRRKFAVAGSKYEKMSIRVYFFKVGGQQRKVCKTMFKNTLCICDSWIDSAVKHCCGSSLTSDKRGL